MKHKYNIGQLVELENGVRLFVKVHTEDRRGLTYKLDVGFKHHYAMCGVPEADLSPIHNPVYRKPLEEIHE